MESVFHTPYGEVSVTMRSLATDIDGKPFVRYSCSVISNDGVVTTPSIDLGLDEPLTQAIVEKAAFSTTPEGKAANRRHNDEIRRYIRERRKP